ncbi:MAG: hypothetical protein J0H88_15065, partial [Sphingomonadales bacterium]|nr:hypothetical protein [Sphingomonadales bacterium]
GRQQLQRGDYPIYVALLRLVDEQGWVENKFFASGREIADAMQLALSIDTFLESHCENREYVQLGKLGIARAISMAEAESKLQPRDHGGKTFEIRALAGTWYYSLARQLFTGIPANRPDLAFENVSFVVFNYDRCLQLFLQKAAEVYFRIRAQEAEKLIANVRFIHPYGSLGSIFPGAAEYVPFGSGEFDLITVASRIKTFSESCDLQAQIRRAVAQADTLIFLGFGFHAQNIELLSVASDFGTNDPPTHQRVFATTKGMSKSDAAVVAEQVGQALRGRSTMASEPQWMWTNDGSCADLFATYWRSLTA